REGTDWFEQDKITGSEASEGDSFGWSVSTTGETSFIGAWGAGDAGVAYAFALSPDDADGDGVLDGCDECPMGDDTIDTDGDTVADDCDACPGFDDSADTDSDGVPDDCEACQVNGLAVDDAADFQNVGMSVAIEGDFAFVGADDDNEAAQSAGAVYVLRRDGIVWSEVAKLVAGDAKGNDHLGWAAAVSDDWLLVGAPYDEDAGQDAGSAYLFKREGADWIEQTELFASDAGAYPLLGYAVDIDGDYAVVGAYGSAYVFAYDGSNWSEQTQLLPSGETEDTQFGWAVGISGDRVVVGASKESAIGDNSGSAYVFRREEGGWVEEAKLEPSDAGHDLEFGVSVSINGERILIGAWGADADAGAGYIFRREGLGWIEEGKLSAGDAEEDAGLGGSVSLDGDRALIGAFRDTDEVSLSGSAYVFQLDGSVWTQQTKLNANDPVENEWFAYSVCLNADYAVIGAPLNSEAGKGAGTAYIFAVAGDCNATGTPDACDILDGLSEDVEGDGVPDECQLLPCEGDANGDGLVDPLDSGFVLSRFGCDVGSGDRDCDLADQNNDGVVDPLDVGFILSRFGVCL
ncbi:MAG: hypothetical protein IH988_11475, partial [Planctomycetes bacterium]|nr:hypothetical protein [Planctomycetota bacterium]